MEVLKISQNEESRYKVQQGRLTHKKKTFNNADYLRKKINVLDKKIEEDLYCDKYRIHGKIDEILFLKDGTASPLDYKYAEYKGKIFKTYKMQSLFYGLLIKENYNIPVNKGYLVYTRSKNYLAELILNEKEFDKLKKILENIFKIIELNYFPKKIGVARRCNDCCYANICIK